MRRIIIIFVVLALLGGGAYIYLKTQTAVLPVNPSGSGSFFPTGEELSPQTPNGSLPITDTPPVEGNTIGQPSVSTTSRFTQISARAVAGFTQFSESYKVPVLSTDPKMKPTTRDITDMVVRYISRGTGYVYEKRNSDQAIQISNIYIPNIYEGYFADKNNTAILRFLRDDNRTIATYLVPVPPQNSDGTRTQKEGTFLPDNILSLFVSPDQTEIGRIYADAGQGVVLTSDTTNKNQKELIRSPFREWLAEWNDSKTIYLQTKAAGTAEGFLYKVDRTERKLRRVLGNINGLTASISPSGTSILYSESSNNNFTTKIFNTKTNNTTTLNLKILPEKCTWLINEDLICAGDSSVAAATYPDSWYAGTSHFSDKLFRIYTKTNTFDILYDNSDLSFDITFLQTQETTNTLYFIDKNTGVLWSFKLS